MSWGGLERLRRGLSIGERHTGHLEKWLSLIGGVVGMAGVMWISQYKLGLQGSAALVASMGASAVLLFAVPHGPLSQPWPVFGGHLLSALLGVTCAQLIPHPMLAAALAVGGAIGTMHYLRCIHPPGGATALTAVAGGDAVHALGYGFVVVPVLLNVLCLLLVAVLFNYPFAWRRYPAGWRPRRAASVDGAGEASATAAEAQAPQAPEDVAVGLNPQTLQKGRYYCNGAFGPHWQVRQILDIPCAADGHTSDAALRYEITAGVGRRRVGTMSCQEMAAWARYEVCLNEIPGSVSDQQRMIQ